jgi:hypothetical protein
MSSKSRLSLTVSLFALTACEFLAPPSARAATTQITACVTSFEIQIVNTSAGQRYRAVVRFAGTPTQNFFTFTPGGPVLQGTGQMAYDAFTKWRDFYELIRTTAQAKVKLAITFDSSTGSISGIGAQYDQPC